MKSYEIVKTEDAPLIDLNTLKNTYDNLQQKHDATIEAASKLKQSISQLDFNENDDAFKNQLIYNIEDVINKNNQYGNVSSAYNDIIRMSGDIISNPSVIGRLKANQQYKAFIDEIDKSDMSDDYKDYFKENNQYYYEDKFDNKGNIIGGSTWTPTTAPTKIIPLSELVTKGIQRAAEDEGYSKVTRWLDKDGNITTNQNEAFDGEIFDTITQTWRKLDRNKIVQSIKTIIDETPGARESIKQDYDIVLWKYEKNNKDISNEVMQSDILDDKGEILTPQQYLDKKLNNAAAIAEYNNSKYDRSFGNGLKSYKAAQKNLSDDKNIDNDKFNFIQTLSSSSGVQLKVKVNVGEEASIKKAQMFEVIKNTLSNAGIDYGSLANTYEDIENFIANNNNIDSNLLSELNAYLGVYKEQDTILKKHLEQIPEGKIDDYMGSMRLLNGEPLDANSSKLESNILNRVNKIYSGAENTRLVFDDETDFNKLISLLTNNGETSIESLGLNIQNQTLNIPKSASNLLPLISNIINANFSSNDYSPKGIYLNYKDTKNLINGATTQTFQGGSYKTPVSDRVSAFNGLNIYYNQANSIITRYSEDYELNDKDVIVPLQLVGDKTWSNNHLKFLYNTGQIDATQYEKNQKDLDDIVYNMIESSNYNDYRIFKAKSGKGIAEEISLEKRIEEGEIIKAAARNKDIVIIPATAEIATDAISGLGGYYIQTFEGESGKKTPSDVYYIPGFGNENAREELLNTPDAIISNKLSIYRKTNSPLYINNVSNNRVFGDVILDPINENSYNVEIFGRTKEINAVDAKDLYKSIYTVNSIIEGLKSHANLINNVEGKNDKEKVMNYILSNENLALTLDSVLEHISITTNIPQKYIFDRLIDKNLWE